MREPLAVLEVGVVDIRRKKKTYDYHAVAGTPQIVGENTPLALLCSLLSATCAIALATGRGDCTTCVRCVHSLPFEGELTDFAVKFFSLMSYGTRGACWTPDSLSDTTTCSCALIDFVRSARLQRGICTANRAVCANSATQMKHRNAILRSSVASRNAIRISATRWCLFAFRATYFCIQA